LRILQLNTYDAGGGAEAVATRLHAAYRSAGNTAWFGVKRKRGTAEGVFAIPRSRGYGIWGRSLLDLADRLGGSANGIRGASALAAALSAAARPGAWVDRMRGLEDFRFPATRDLAALTPVPPDVVQCHNLHGGYFDLGALAHLSRTLPVVLTLHDGWLLSGHCAHSFDCERWRTGCGSCPDLDIYPAVRRDATAANWARKRDVYRGSRLFVAAPSRWLLDRARQSMLADGIVDSRVIENGIDDAFFAAGDRAATRTALGIGPDDVILAFASNTVRCNMWKDFPTLRSAAAKIAESLSPHRRVVLMALGECAPEERAGAAVIRYCGFLHNPSDVAAYLRAADFYVHATRAETFSLSVAEAMACGTPVIATAVGALTERIRSLALACTAAGVETADVDAATGVLVAPQAPDAIAAATLALLDDPALARRIGENAAAEARVRYTMQRQASAYLEWFERLVAAR
jgi:glycosyltransferase involved in cell wall biosynthesis